MTTVLDQLLKNDVRDADGRSLATLILKCDPKMSGWVSQEAFHRCLCQVLRREPSTVSEEQIQKAVELKPVNGRIRYGPFLRRLRESLSHFSAKKESDAGGMEFGGDDGHHANKGNVINYTTAQVEKILEERLPLYHGKASKAFLQAKQGGGHPEMTRKDFRRFLLHMNVDCGDRVTNQLFDKYDTNGNGQIHAAEFIDAFGPAICGGAEISKDGSGGGTSLKMDNGNPTLKPHVYSGQFDDLETVKKFIHDRLWMYFNSSTKAFLVAKGRKKGNEMTLKDAKLFLINMNIDVPDRVIRALLDEIDKDNSGHITCDEFIAFFGDSISGGKITEMKGFPVLSENQTLKRVPLKPKWTLESVRATLGQRLGLYRASATKAFLKAKRCKSMTMNFNDLKLMLANLNIECDDSVTREIMQSIDVDGDGCVDCAEFINAFGGDICGYSGSMDVMQPIWVTQEMKRIDGMLEVMAARSKGKGDAEPETNEGPETALEAPRLGTPDKDFKPHVVKKHTTCAAGPAVTLEVNGEAEGGVKQDARQYRVAVLEEEIGGLMKHIEETNRIDQAEQQLKLKMRVRALTKDLVEAKIKLKDMGAPEGTPKGGFGRITQQRRRPQSAGPQRRRLSDMQQSMRMVNRALLDSEEPVTQTAVGAPSHAPSPVHSQQSLGTETHRIHRNSTLVKKMERAQALAEAFKKHPPSSSNFNRSTGAKTRQARPKSASHVRSSTGRRSRSASGTRKSYVPKGPAFKPVSMESSYWEHSGIVHDRPWQAY